MDITSKLENGVLTIFAEGRVDSTTAAAAEAAIEAARATGAHDSVVLDADKLEYISSAGLRVVLRLRKNEPDMKIINVSSDVYEVFEMTGFTEMLPIEKGYRHLSVDGCEVIGQGANGKVYRLDPDTIIKVYLNPDSLPDIHRERELARRAFVLGVPTAIPYDVVKVGEGYGSVFELLNAKSFAKLMDAEPEKLDEYVGMYIDLLKKIHDTVVRPEDMPDMREVALDWAKFVANHIDPEKGKKLVALVEAVPVDHHMMHGDYHIKNVMLQNGEALLIDMDTLCQGHPVFELGSMFNAYRGFSELDHSISRSFLGISHEMAGEIWKKSLLLYFDGDEKKANEAEKKAMLIGYMRLLRRGVRRNVDPAETAHYRKRIETLLDEVDTLLF